MSAAVAFEGSIGRGTNRLSRQTQCECWTEFFGSGTRSVAAGWGYWEGIEVMSGPHPLTRFEMSSNMHTIFAKIGSPTRYDSKHGSAHVNPLLVEGSVSIVRAQTRWVLEADGSPQSLIGVKVDPDFLDRCARSAGITFNAYGLESRFGLIDRRITEILKLLAEDLAAGSPFGKILGESLSHVLAVHVATHYGTVARDRTVDASRLSGNTVAKVKDYIRENLYTPLSLAEIAETVGYSPYHLHRAFRQDTGMRLHEYIQSVRVEVAQFLLRTSDWSTARIAAEVGFSDASHLSRQIKRVLGVTPSELRRSARSS